MKRKTITIKSTEILQLVTKDKEGKYTGSECFEGPLEITLKSDTDIRTVRCIDKIVMPKKTPRR